MNRSADPIQAQAQPWSMFYRLLGIESARARPTAYELLGLAPQTCDPHTIAEALARRRQQLRRHLSTPRLFPLVLAFERELDLAARTLTDPTTREHYDHRQASLNDTEKDALDEQEQRRLQQIVTAVKATVENLLNPDRTLDNDKRPLVAYRMRELGIRMEDIQGLLSRIPSPVKPDHENPAPLPSPQQAASTTTTTEIPAQRFGWNLGLKSAMIAGVLITFTLVFLMTSLLHQAPPSSGDSSADQHANGAVRTAADESDLSLRLVKVTLLDRLLRAGATPQQQARLLEAAQPAEIETLIARLAEDVDASTLPAGEADRLVTRLASLNLSAAAQDHLVAAMFTLIQHQPRSDTAARAGAWLARLLQLAGTPPARLYDATGWTALGLSWRQAWAISRERYPADPLHDPRRLAEAVVAGQGFLSNYLPWTNQRRYTDVARHIAVLAARSNDPTAIRARSALKYQLSRRSDAPGWVRSRTLLALADIVHLTSIPESARHAMNDVLDALHPGPATRAELLTLSLSTAYERSLAADRLASLVQAQAPNQTANPGIHPPAAIHRSLVKLRAAFDAASTAPQPEPRLTELALASLAIRAYATRALADDDNPLREFESALASDNPTRSLTRSIELHAPRVDESEQLNRLKQDLQSSNQGRRYAAIEKLAVIGSYQAVTLLLNTLDFPLPLPTLYRVVRALPRLKDNRIPHQLIAVLVKTNRPPLASVITESLMRGVHLVQRPSAFPFPDEPRVEIERDLATLGPRNSHTQRKVCAKYWQSILSRSRWTWGDTNNSPSTSQPNEAPAWSPDPTSHKLLGAVTFPMRMLADQLQSAHWRDRGAGLTAARQVFAPAGDAGPDYAGEYLDALDRIVHQLNRLLREHPAVRQRHAVAFANRADMILLKRQVRTLASKTSFQKAAVDLDAAASLLELLLQMTDSSSPGIPTTAHDRADAADNVLVELRELTYRNAEFWSRLADRLRLANR